MSLDVFSASGKFVFKLQDGSTWSLAPGWVFLLDGKPAHFFPARDYQFSDEGEVYRVSQRPLAAGVRWETDMTFQKRHPALEVIEIAEANDGKTLKSRIISEPGHSWASYQVDMPRSTNQTHWPPGADMIPALPDDDANHKFFRTREINGNHYGLVWVEHRKAFDFITFDPQRTRWEIDEEGYEDEEEFDFKDLETLLRDKGMI